ncbi:MAG: hypothetical protein FJ405_08260 [Verrucomicrobia bacterium]|nr:hypothetical protein [Verrucomicrobiota bacterium]
MTASSSGSVAALFVLFFLGMASVALAQLPGGANSFNPALLQLFDGHKAFSARAELRVLDPQRRETIRTSIQMAYLNGKVRAEVSLSSITSQRMSTDALDLFKQAGMDPVVSVLLPDRKVSIVSFPTVKVFAEEPMGPEEAAEFGTRFSVTKTLLGKEVVAGESCDKSSISITSTKGASLKGTIWAAPALKGFPLRIQLPEGENLMEMTFTDVKLTAPGAESFEAPKGFRRYEGMDKLIADRMQSLTGVK